MTLHNATSLCQDTESTKDKVTIAFMNVLAFATRIFKFRYQKMSNSIHNPGLVSRLVCPGFPPGNRDWSG